MTTANQILEDIKRAQREIESHGMLPGRLNNPFSFAGIRVFEEPLPPPKLKLSDDVICSDGKRKEFNDWLLARFGRHDPLCNQNKMYFMPSMNAMIGPPGIAGLLSSSCVV